MTVHRTLQIVIIFACLFIINDAFAQKPINPSLGIATGDVEILELNDGGFVVLSLIGNDNLIIGSKKRQITKINASGEVDYQTEYTHKKQHSFNNMIYDESKDRIFVCENGVGTTNYSHWSKDYTVINNTGQVSFITEKELGIKEESKEFKYVFVSSFTKHGIIYRLAYRDFSDELENALESEWKSKSKEERGLKIFKNGKQLVLLKIDIDNKTATTYECEVPHANPHWGHKLYYTLFSIDNESFQVYTQEFGLDDTESFNVLNLSLYSLDFKGKLISSKDCDLEFEGFSVCPTTPIRQANQNLHMLVRQVYRYTDKKLINELIGSFAQLTPGVNGEFFVSVLANNKFSFWKNKVYSPNQLHIYKFDSNMEEIWHTKEDLSSKFSTGMGKTVLVSSLNKTLIVEDDKLILQVASMQHCDVHQFDSRGKKTDDLFFKFANKTIVLTGSKKAGMNDFYTNTLHDIAQSGLFNVQRISEINYLKNKSKSKTIFKFDLNRPYLFINNVDSKTHVLTIGDEVSKSYIFE